MNYFTLDEKKKIAEYIRKYPANLSLAFDLAGKELGRNPRCVRNHWYGIMKHETRLFPSLGEGKNIKNISRIDKEVAKARLEKKLEARSAVKSDKARVDVLAITKALRALARK